MRNTLLSTAFLGFLTVAIPAAADQHLVIVSIGDSLAAGEGNPNSFSLAGGAVWSNTPCHRSVNNGRRFASTRINSMNDVSTTLFEFSCSGATIEELWRDGQQTDQPDANNVQKLPQIDQVVNALGRVPGTNRTDATIDILMISVGINNANFKNVVQKCLTDVGDCTDSAQVGVAIGNIAGLAPKYAELGIAIRQRLPNVRQVYITEYPNEVASVPGNFCGDLNDGSGDVSMSLVTAAESQFLFNNVLSRLNDQVQQAANNNGWRFVQGPEDTFATHGYCTLGRRFVNTALDSVTRQGNENGTMHPNVAGQRAYADALIARATVDFDLPLETPRVVRTAEFNVGLTCDFVPTHIPNCVALPAVRKAVQVEIAQHPGTLSVTLQHRVINPPVCVPFLGCSTPPVPAFANTAMADSGSGRLNLFSAQIPNSEFLLPGQTLQYRAVITATRGGQTTNFTTPVGTIVLAEPLVGTLLLP